ncbi:MAG TPA: hypothetical protein EYG79_07950 [Rhodobacteraceae bacterium]|nr:hypothetical protein [Paracoccaceae bacterium]
MKVIICGNSHIVAIRKAYNALESDHPTLKIFPLGGANSDDTNFSSLRENGVAFDLSLYSGLLEKFTGDNLIDDSGIWGFSIGSHFSRIYSTALLRHYQPSSVAEAGARPMSRGVIEAIIRGNQQYVFQFFSNLQQKNIRFFVILAPPPPANYNVFEKKGIKREAIARFDRVARSSFKSKLAEMGVEFLDVPEKTCDEDGLLLPAYKLDKWHDGKPDPHHANQEYGALVVDQIFKHIEQYGEHD